MAMGRQKDGQGDLMVSWSEMPRSPGHVFYDRLQSVLVEGGFDAFAEASCRPYTRPGWARPRCRPGRYFRMHLVVTSRASTASAVWSGAARTRFRCGRSCDWGAVIGYRTIPGCHGAAPACPMKSTRRSSTGFWC